MNQLAHHLVKKSTESMEDEHAVLYPPTQASVEEISRVMAELGRRGGRLGGAARAASMTPERRREIALKAARKRWDNPGSEEKAKN